MTFLKSNAPYHISLVQMSAWNVAFPPIALAILTGNLRSGGYSVFPKDYDIRLYNEASDDGKKRWTHSAAHMYWEDEAKVKSLIKKRQAFFNDCVNDILSDHPDIVGFSVQLRSRFITLHMARKLKEKKPDIYIVLGGPEASKGPGDYLEPYPFIDAICMGEADISFPNFLDQLKKHDFLSVRKKKNDGVKNNKTVFFKEPGWAYRNTDGRIIDGGKLIEAPLPEDIPFADYTDFDFSRYLDPNSMPMLMSRGCINHCVYCNESPFFLKYRSYPAKRVIEEIKHVINITNIQSPLRIIFSDSLINGNLKELEKFADMLMAKPIPGLKYTGMMFTHRKMKNTLIEKLAETGLDTVSFGLESGSEAVLKCMRKPARIKDAERLFKKTHECGIKLGFYMIVGHPGETEEEFYKSLFFFRKMAKYAAENHIAVNVLLLTEHAYLTSHPEEFGIRFPEDGEWECDSGRNNATVRKFRRQTARDLLYDKVMNIGGSDFDSGLYYDQRPFLLDEIKRRGKFLPDAFKIARLFSTSKMTVVSKKNIVSGFVESIQKPSPDENYYQITGWGICPAKKAPARHVCLIDKDRNAMGYTVPGLEREDIAAAKGSEYLKSGWRLLVDPEFAHDIENRLFNAFVIDTESTTAFELSFIF